jgi:hypothetical protein
VRTELKLGSTVSLSGGATTLPGDALDARILLEVADLATHRAKHRRKVQVFHPSVDSIYRVFSKGLLTLQVGTEYGLIWGKFVYTEVEAKNSSPSVGTWNEEATGATGY